MFTIADVKAMLAAHQGPIMNGPELALGNIVRDDGSDVEYKIHGGWNVQLANACDDQWGEFNVQLLEYIKARQVEGADVDQLMDNVQLDDAHWQWLAKSFHYKTDDFKWFFLMADQQPQGACLIYFPKDSAIDGQNIFYIEYVAAAPWNRHNPMAARRFKGIGRILVDFAHSYGVDQLGLRSGYCLHALPKAVPFYLSLGMQAFPNRDKNNLPYFELPPQQGIAANGVANGL